MILIDDTLPPTMSAREIATLRQTGVSAPILVMSMFSKRDRIRCVLQAGANGYIVKGEFMQELAQAIRAVYRGECYLSPWVVAALEEEEE